MKIQTNQLIQELKATTQSHINFAEELLQLPDSDLQFKTEPTKWNTLECLEHLNLYGDFYIPKIQTSIQNNKRPSVPEFTSGRIGNYLSVNILPSKKGMTMKTFKSKNPIQQNLDKSTIIRFIDQQKQLISLFENSNQTNLNTVKIETTLGMFIKLRLGDIFRFVVNHNIRHIVQIQNIPVHANR